MPSVRWSRGTGAKLQRWAGEGHRGRDSHVETVCCRQKPPLGHQYCPTAVLPAPQPQAHLPGPLPKRGCAAAHYPGQGPGGCQAAVCGRASMVSPVQRGSSYPLRGWNPNPALCAPWEGQRVVSGNAQLASLSQPQPIQKEPRERKTFKGPSEEWGMKGSDFGDPQSAQSPS